MAEPQWIARPLVVRWRERSRVVDIVVRMILGWSRHRTGRNAALVAHFAFLSVFPLLVVLTTILGFVLEGRPDLQARIIDSALGRIPIIGPKLAADPSSLHGDVLVLVLGLATSLWAGMKAFVAVQHGLDDVDERAGFGHTRLHALVGIGVIGGAQVLTTVSSSIAGWSNFAIVNRVLLVVGSVAVNSLAVAFTFRWLRTERHAWQTFWPGAIAAGTIYAALQYVGTSVVGRAISKASPIYGTFALTIGVLTWLSLHAMVALGGAELNATLRRAPDPTDATP
jgi:uncharacterized BrkB/YihY/UPF0761 family membrane protein